MADISIDSDSGKFKAGDGQDLNLYHNGTNSFIENETGILYVTNKASASLILGTANTTAVTIDNSQNATFAGNVNITSSSNVYLSIDTTQSNGDEWQILNAVSGTTSGLQFKDIDTSKLVMLLQEDGNVGIGTSSPSNPLEVAVGAADESVKLSCYSTTDAHHGALLLTKSANATIGTAAATAAGETLGAIVAQGHRTGDNAVKAAASIKFQGDAAPDGDSVPGRIIFSTSDADDAGSPTERMRIDDAGNVGIGALIDDFTPTLGVTGAQPGLVLDDSATEAFFVAYCDGDVSVIMYDHSDSFIIKQAESIGGSSAADVLKLDSSKNATFSGKVIINQSTDNASISIDTASTGNHAILVDGPLTQTGCAGLLVNDCDALTSGSAIQIQCASTSLATTAAAGLVMINHTGNSSTNVNNLLFVKNDNASATGTTVAYLQQDAAQTAMHIELNANAKALNINTEGTTSEGVQIVADSVTTGPTCKIYSDSSSANARNILDVRNDNASADSAVPIYAKQVGNARAIQVEATDASFTSNVVFLNAVGRSASSSFEFLVTYTDGSDDVQHNLRGDGVVQADAAYDGSGADYAEYFESNDGKAIAVGTTVKLDGDKIVACEDGDTPMGVARPNGNSVVIGNSASLKWTGKYLKDDYGAYIMEEYTVTEWMEYTDEIKKEAVLYVEEDEIPEGKKVGDIKESAKYFKKDIQYQTDKIPSDVTVPDDATVKSTEYDGTKLMRKKLNPDYDESKTYEPREERDEWCLIGLLGPIPITKGQPVSSNWIKMKDVSDTVEMYFVK